MQLDARVVNLILGSDGSRNQSISPIAFNEIDKVEEC
jgi:hypothetical protein